MSRSPCLLFFSTYGIVCISLPGFPIFFKIASDQPIPFSWPQPNSVEDMECPSRSPSYTTPAASSTPGDSPYSATGAVSTLPFLSPELPLHAVSRSFSAQCIVPASVQATSSPTRAVAPVSMRSDCMRFRDEEHLLPVKRFRSGEELFSTRLETCLLCELAAPTVQGVACGGRETNTVAALTPSESTVSTPWMEVSVYVSRFWYRLYDSCFSV